MSRLTLLLLVACATVPEDTALPLGGCEPEGEEVGPQALAGTHGLLGSTGIVTADDGWYLLVDHEEPDGESIATWFSADEGQTWTPSLPLALVSDRYVGNVSTVRFAGEQWVYFQSAFRPQDPPILWRSRFEGNQFGPAEAVRPLRHATSWSSAPAFWSDGGAVWVGYRSEEGAPAMAVAADGVLFSDVQPPLEEPVDSFFVGAFGDGTILAVWQQDDGPALLSQTIGEGWTPARNISSQFSEVQDVRALLVERGRIDLYYRTDDGLIHRRPVFGAGGASPEEVVDTSALGPVAKPIPYRLPDCRVLLTVADDDGGVGLTILDADAPVP